MTLTWRGWLLALVLICSVAARAAAEPPFPVPPLPPTHPPMDQSAPVPDTDLQPAPTDSASQMRFSVGILRPDRPDLSKGYAPGSRYLQNDEKRQFEIPGFKVSLPLSRP